MCFSIHIKSNLIYNMELKNHFSLFQPVTFRPNCHSFGDNVILARKRPFVNHLVTFF